MSTPRTDEPRFFDATKRFELRARLGRGGMGSVHLVFDHRHGTEVALKSVGAVTGEALLRFKREFRAVQDLDHPNLVHLGELFEDAGNWFYTMERVDGVDFLEHVRGGPSLHDADEPTRWDAPTHTARLDEARLRAALAQLVSGLSALHELGRVHRDVKPSNVLVTRDGRVVLLDFGLVTTLEHGVQATDVLPIGTVAYMAPEQAAGLAVDERADAYAVGVMLYEALTGRRPFEGMPLQVITRQQSEEALPPSALLASVPTDLDALAVALLRRDPALRPSDSDVARALGHEERPLRRASRIFLDGTSAEGRFVGRESELATLHASYERVRDGESAIVAVVGPAGIGKSALVRHFLREARLRDPRTVVFSGKCHEHESTPYKAMDGVIDEVSRTLKLLPAADVHALLPSNVDVVARVFRVLERVPAVDARLRTSKAVPDRLELRARFFEAVRELFRRIASSRPTICVIDDLQWSDADSHMLLSELFRQPDAPAVLLVAMMRPWDGETPAALRERSRSADEVLYLSPLSTAESRMLADGLVPSDVPRRDALVTRIVREAAGHPLFLRALHDHVASGDAALAIPDLDAALLRRLEDVGPDERRVVELLAVAGCPLAQEIVTEAARIEPEQAARGWKGLRLSRLVLTHGPLRTDSVELAHDRVREAILAALDDTTRREHHAALARAMDAHRGDPAHVVRHFRGAGRIEEAAELAVLAAERAEAALAFERAARFYALALELGAFDAERRRALVVRSAEALANAGRGVAAADLFLEAVEGASRDEALELRFRSGSELVRNGHLDRGLELLEGVLAELGRPAPKSLARGLPALAWHQLTARFRRVSIPQRDPATVSPDERLAVDAAYAIMSGLGAVEPIRSLFLQRRHLHGALATGDPFRIARAAVFELLSVGIDGSRATARTDRLLAEFEAALDGSRDPRVLAIASLLRGTAAFYRADWAGCLEHTERASARFRSECVGMFWELSTAESLFIEGLRASGEWKRLRERTPRLIEECRERGDRIAEALWACACPTFIHVLDDTPDQGLRESAEGLRAWGREGTYTTVSFGHFYFVPWLHAYSGDAETAHELAEREWPAFRGSLLSRVQTLRFYAREMRGLVAVHAALAKEEGRARRLAIARGCASALEREGHPVASAVAALVRAGADAVRGDRARTVDALTELVARFETVGMHGYAHAARRHLGLHRGDARGAELVRTADQWMLGQGVKKPESVARLLAPGFTPA